MQGLRREGHIRPLGPRVRRRTGSLIAILCVAALANASCAGSQTLGPEDIWASNTALVAVDKATIVLAGGNAADWGQLRQGRTLTVERDNPPIWGYLPYSGSVAPTPLSAGTGLSRRDTPMARSYVWDKNDVRFSGTAGISPSDDLNSGGLGIAPVGPIEPGHVRYHTNGLLLTPGRSVTIGLERLTYSANSWAWEQYANQSAAGSLELDPATALVPVQVLLVDEPNGTQRFAVSPALAQLWLDGRTVDRLQTSRSDDGTLNSFVQDRDARPGYEGDHREPWGPDETSGRQGGPLNQQIDEVWCQCAFFDRNIQFRLVNVEHIRSVPDPRAANCAAPGSISDPYQAETCVRFWTGAAHPPSGLHPLTLVFVHDFIYRDAVAEAFVPEHGAIVSDRSLSSATGQRYPQTILAHELGHLLGGYDAHFDDGLTNLSPVENLMRSHAPIITGDQCRIAYENATRIAMFPVAP